MMPRESVYGAALARLSGALLDLVYPRQCVMCGVSAPPDGRSICWDCRAGLDFITEGYCRCCGDPVDGMVEHDFRCDWCSRHRVAFEMARSAVRYRGGMCDAVQGFKYRHDTSLCVDFVALLKASVEVHFGDVAFDAVTFVPLYPRKERARTFNQARLLAEGLAREMPGVPLVGSLRRVRATETQTHLTASQRRRNVKGAFEALDRAWLRGRTLLLVDDVMTTGATMDECARTLRKAGVHRVFVVTVARG